MKVLVTGGAGFIGSHVVDAYLAEGYHVVVVDNLSTGRLSNLNPAAKFYQVDIRSPQLSDVFEAERPDFVNHHAAQMDVRRSMAEPVLDADINILGSINLLECARRSMVRRLIYISTGGAVYGEPEYLPCDEEHPIKPICQYGASKHTVEHYLYMYQQNYGLDYTVLRYPNVYGPRQDPHGEAGVVAIFAGQMLAGEKGVINGQILPFETQMGLKLSDVAKFVTMTNQGSAAKCLVMRKQTWESLPPDIQKIIEDMNPWEEELMYKVGMAAYERISGLSKQAGVDIIELSPTERARWDEATKSVEKDWFAEMDAKGLPATALYKDIMKMKGK